MNLKLPLIDSPEWLAKNFQSKVDSMNEILQKFLESDPKIDPKPELTLDPEPVTTAISAPLTTTSKWVWAKPEPKFSKLPAPKKTTWVSRTVNGKDLYSHKYTEDQKLFFVNCLGHCMSPSEIYEAFKETYEAPLENHYSVLTYYKQHPKWQKMINEIKIKYLSDVNAVAGSHKRVRLERADRIYDRAYGRNTEKSDSVALSAIDHQKREFDKHEYNQVNILNQQYINMSDEELTERKKWLVDKLKLIKEVS